MALEQSGIIVDMIAGTSAGAMTGTIYASGMDVDCAVDHFVQDLTPSWPFRRLRHGGYWYLLYKYLVQNVNMNSEGVQPADLIIDLDVTDFDLSEFTRTGELAAIGAETTEASIERIGTALAELDKQLFAASFKQFL